MTDEVDELRSEVERLLADALRVKRETNQESDRIRGAHEKEMASMQRALDTRDLIGQAKGIIMASLGCDAAQAFELLREQSQAENRKLTEIAAEIASRVERRARRTA